MIFSLVFSFILILLITFLAVGVSGGSLLYILDLPSFAGVLLIFAISIILSGNGKVFCSIFSSHKKFAAFDFQQLKKADEALDFSIKLLFYSAILIPVLILIYTLSNASKSEYFFSHLGLNFAVLLLSLLYLSLLEMILITAKAKIRKSSVLFMAEDFQQNDSKQDSKQKADVKSVFKNITGFVLLAAVFTAYGIFSGVYSWGSGNVIFAIIDLPSIMIQIFFVLPLIAISGNFSILFKGLKSAFCGIKIDLKSKNLFQNALKSAMSLNWCSCFATVICSAVCILGDLSDFSKLSANLAVGFIPFFYVACVNLVLLFAEIKVCKAAL
ncbi:MAG: hypothetical protein PUK76_08630 [Treponema sp.]|nr:hypothetical protein [Treponema sp.]MDY2923971.1 hypothetical protein [Treponema sp.]